MKKYIFTYIFTIFDTLQFFMQIQVSTWYHFFFFHSEDYSLHSSHHRSAVMNLFSFLSKKELLVRPTFESYLTR